MKMKQSFVLLTLAACMAFACKKSNKGDDQPKEQAGKIQGMGDSTGTPKGEPFVLPEGITINGEIRGDLCDTTYSTGSGSLVQICVALFNSRSADVTLTIPGGLILLATDAAENQHGVVIQESRVVLKANKLTRVGINSYCINASKSPSSYNDLYSLGPVSSSVLMQELILLLKNKKINRDDYTDYDAYRDAIDNVQGLVWSVSDGPAEDPADRTRLIAEIPNK
jgi:hypothetical protein